MGVRDFYRSAKEKVGSYFSRREAEQILNDDRGRNAQVGYKQRETWFDKFLAGTGKVLKYLGFGAAVATGIGAIALGTQYIRGAWPYRDVRENAYVITQNAITEKPARPLKQGVNAFIPPFVRLVEKDSQPVTISGIIQSAETPEFEYRSEEGLIVGLKTQYNFQVTKPEGAAKVYWDYGGLEMAHKSLDTIIENALMNELSRVPAKEIASEERIAKEGEEIFYGGKYTKARGGEKINYLVEAENRANELLGKERTGIVVTNFAISRPRFSKTVEEAWEQPTIAQNEANAEVHKARGRIIKAQSEAQEALIQAQGTAQATREKYLPVAAEIAEAEGRRENIGNYVMSMRHDDNNQQMLNTAAKEKARILFVPGGSAGLGSQQTPQVVVQNVRQTTQKEEPKMVDATSA